MGLPTPVPGLVIRYAFLWSHEAEAGAEEAAKDRPCAIVLAVRRAPGGALRVVVAPITHRPPDDPAESLELAPATARNLGLDGGRHWLRVDELNSFEWPGFDIRPIPGRGRRIDYGMLPRDLYEALRRLLLERRAFRKTQARDT